MFVESATKITATHNKDLDLCMQLVMVVLYGNAAVYCMCMHVSIAFYVCMYLHFKFVCVYVCIHNIIYFFDMKCLINLFSYLFVSSVAMEVRHLRPNDMW